MRLRVPGRTTASEPCTFRESDYLFHTGRTDRYRPFKKCTDVYILCKRAWFARTRAAVDLTLEGTPIGSVPPALAMQAGARGYLLKTIHHEELAAAICKVHRGEVVTAAIGQPQPKPTGGLISQRELEVLRWTPIVGQSGALFKV